MGRGSEPKPKGANRLSLNLLEQLSFYGAYHTNPINQLIHFVFVPTILFSILVWLARFQFGDLASVASHAGLSVPAALQGIPVSASAVVVVIYSLFYLCLDFFAGLSWAALIGMPLCWGAHVLRAHPQADTIAGVLQLVSWYMQVRCRCAGAMSHGHAARKAACAFAWKPRRPPPGHWRGPSAGPYMPDIHMLLDDQSVPCQDSIGMHVWCSHGSARCAETHALLLACTCRSTPATRCLRSASPRSWTAWCRRLRSRRSLCGSSCSSCWATARSCGRRSRNAWRRSWRRCARAARRKSSDTHTCVDAAVRSLVGPQLG